MNTKLSLPSAVTICEVAPRDGFQSLPHWIETDKKIAIIKRLFSTNVPAMEITSFVHPRAIPQLKDAETVVTTIYKQQPNVNLRALVPNKKGAERAVASGIKKIKTMLSASDSHSLSNANATVKDAQEKLMPIFEYAAKHDVAVMGSVSVAFGCPYEGRVPIDQIVAIIHRYESVGVKEISLADTTGMAEPKQVYETLSVLKNEFPTMEYSMHFHNTRGLALANIFASLQCGVTMFDSSIAGLGGCPYAPGATGNVATEDVVHMFDQMEIQTSMDVNQCINVAKEVKDLIGVPGDSYMLTAGPSHELIKERPVKQEK